MDRRAEKIIVPLLRWIVGGVFIYAGIMKAIDPAQFAKDVDSFRMFPLPAAAAISLYLPWLEILSGAALAAKVWHQGASLVIGGLLVAFLIALSTALARGLDLTCGCLGHATNKTNYPLALFTDIVLLAFLGMTRRSDPPSP